MKSLPFKLTIFIILLFAAVIATCLAWTPVKIRYYGSKLHSDNPKEQVSAVDVLLGMGQSGKKVLQDKLEVSEKEIEFLAKHWRRNNKPGENIAKGSPLYWAIRNDYRSAARLLISSGADVNENGGRQFTLLMLAILCKNKEIVRELIENGAYVNAKDSVHDYSPLHLAAKNGLGNIVNILIKRGADVNAKGRRGYQPLHCAMIKGHTDIARHLVKEGADVNVHDNWGRTPLHFAALLGHMESAKLLIEKGADVNARNKGKMPIKDVGIPDDGTNICGTPLEFATNINMKSLLRAHGGKTGKEIRESAPRKRGR
ncbi:MAG: hypothetical protein E3J72_10830 [Planctomycetota bacterium]|nr:MAG: hypothetical protein E3J72_10830 [Planctomycetota bacterium]